MILHFVEFFVNDKTNGNYEFIYYEYRKKKENKSEDIKTLNKHLLSGCTGGSRSPHT